MGYFTYFSVEDRQDPFSNQCWSAAERLLLKCLLIMSISTWISVKTISSLRGNFCIQWTKAHGCTGNAENIWRANLCLLSLASQTQCVLSGKETPCSWRRQDVSTQNCVSFFSKSPADTPVSLGTTRSCLSATQPIHKLLKILRTDNRIFKLSCYCYDVCINNRNINRILRRLRRKSMSIYCLLWNCFLFVWVFWHH